VLLWLAVFLVVTIVVIARDAAGLRTASRVAELRNERQALEAQRAELVRRIRAASSRRVLIPKAEHNLGLRNPTDSEYLLFPLPATQHESLP